MKLSRFVNFHLYFIKCKPKESMFDGNLLRSLFNLNLPNMFSGPSREYTIVAAEEYFNKYLGYEEDETIEIR